MEMPVEFRFGDVTWHASAASFPRAEAWLQRHFLSIFDRVDSLLKKDTGSRVAAADGFVIKESTARRGRSGVRFGMRRSGSLRAFRLGVELTRLGVRTPRPVAWATVRRLGIRMRDFLITEHVCAASSLSARFEECRRHAENRKRLMEALGHLLASFHVQGYSNRDLKDTNVLAGGDDGRELWAVDLDGVRRIRITRRRAIKDLWPIVRSLKMHGMGDANDKQNILNGYNSLSTLGLRMEELPGNY